MVLLFALEFVEGNTITRLYFMRLRRLARVAVTEGRLTPELARARAEQLASFTHFLDIPILLVIVSLGALRPSDWKQFVIGTVIAVGGSLVVELFCAAPLSLGRRSSSPMRSEDYARDYGTASQQARRLAEADSEKTKFGKRGIPAGSR